MSEGNRSGLRFWLDLPPVWLLFFITLAWAQNVFLPGLSVRSGFSVTLGQILLATGFLLMFAAVFEMSRAKTTVMPKQTASALVTSGVFRLTRNPIYLGDALVLGGCALMWGGWTIVLVPVFGMVITRRFILGEEAGLKQEFGSAFEDWARRTPRWIGPV